MELNGISNIQMLVDIMTDDKEISTKNRDKIMEQLDTLNRYMTHIGAKIQEHDIEISYWHEVRDNKDMYPTNGELHWRSKNG